MRTLTYKGITKTIPEWAAEVGLEVPTLRARLKAGWSIKNALFRIPLGRYRTAKTMKEAWYRDVRRMRVNREFHSDI